LSDTSDEGGEAACWLHLVCDRCGALVDDLDAHACEPSTDRSEHGEIADSAESADVNEH
jgi:hypothetical protein